MYFVYENLQEVCKQCAFECLCTIYYTLVVIYFFHLRVDLI